MENLPHRPVSVGSLVKKILAIRPDLGVPEIIEIVRESSRSEGSFGLDLASSGQVVDEERALDLARSWRSH